MRLIDADKLCRTIKIEANPYGKPTLDFKTACAILDMIADAPTVDEVIRCEDCKYRMTEIFNDKKTMYYCPFVDRYTVNDWYCADGERKDDEDD